MFPLPFFRLINKLQPGSVKKINLSQLNWHKVRLFVNWMEGLLHCLPGEKKDGSNRSKHHKLSAQLPHSWRFCCFLLTVEFVQLSSPAFSLYFPLILLLSAAGEPWEFHQSYPGLWPKAQWHIWGQRPVWKWEHDSSPDHTACTGEHGEWKHRAK